MTFFRATTWLCATLFLCCSPFTHANILLLGSHFYGQGDAQIDQVRDAVGSNDGRFLYVLADNDEGNTTAITVLKINEPGSQPELVQILKPNGPNGNFVSFTFDLVLSPDGTHLYALTQPSSVAGGLDIYVIEPGSGRLIFNYHEYYQSYDQFHFVDEDHVLYRSGSVTGIAERDPISGRLTSLQTYRNYYDLPYGVADLPPIHEAHLTPQQNRLILYHRDDAAFSVIELDSDFAPIDARTIHLDRRFIETGNPLDFVRFTNDGRHVMLAGAAFATLYEVFLDLDQVSFADFRRTGLPNPGNSDGTVFQQLRFDAGTGRLFVFHGRSMSVVDTAFPYGPTTVAAAQTVEPGAGNAASFLGTQNQLITFPERQRLQVWDDRNNLASPSLRLDFRGGLGFQGFENPRDLAIAPNGLDLYVSNGAQGLTHVRRDPQGIGISHVANIVCDQHEQAHVFEQLRLSRDGRNMYVQNSTTLRHINVNPTDGALALIASHPLNHAVTSGDLDAALVFTQNEDHLLSIGRDGDLRVFQRQADGSLEQRFAYPMLEGAAPLAGKHAATINEDDTLFVLLTDGSIRIHPRDEENTWTQQQVVAARPDFEPKALFFDSWAERLWVRGKTGIAVYDWDAEQQSLQNHDFLEDDEEQHFGADGPILFDEKQALVANEARNSITVLVREGDTWKLTQTMMDRASSRIRLRGMTAMAWSPTEPYLYVLSQEDQTLNLFIDTVLNEAKSP